jgi:ribosome-associated protein
MSARKEILIPESEYTLTAVRSSGPGGQHVNKVATAIILKFDIINSSLPEDVKGRLLKRSDRRITADGIIVIKSGASRSQMRNKETVIERLRELVQQSSRPQKRREPTKPSKKTIEMIFQNKSRRIELKSQIKKLD